MRNYIAYLKMQAKFFVRAGLYILVLFILFLISLDLYGHQMIYVERLDVYAPQQYQRDIPLVHWVSDKDKADAYVDSSGVLHITTYNQLKRNLLIYLFSGEKSDWKVVIVKNLLSMDMIRFYDTLYGIIYLVIVISFTTGYNFMMHKVRRTGAMWKIAGLSKWEIVALEILFAFMISLVALIFKVPWYVFITTFMFLVGFGIMVGSLSKDIESYTVLLKILSILFILPILYFFIGDKVPKIFWYIIPTFHPVMVIASPIVKTPLSVSTHVWLTIIFSLMMIVIPVYFTDFE
ncbi:hypothetical protein GM182_00985 [bacterium 3DAC]|nr:hypothetical protein GM182_00985 [bacterium 3DAC]